MGPLIVALRLDRNDQIVEREKMEDKIKGAILEDEKAAEEDLEERAYKAAVRYLERKGYEILEEHWKSLNDEVLIVAREGNYGPLVFCEVQASDKKEDGMMREDDSEERRNKLEKSVSEYLEQNKENEELCDISVRFDCISMLVIGEDRALLRHHMNA